jgi:hypothetical protein
MTKDLIFPEEELLNELMELYQESERPLTREQLIRGYWKQIGIAMRCV